MPSVRGGTSQSCGSQGSLKFVVDAQLPPALARVLRDSGCDAVAVREIGLCRRSIQNQPVVVELKPATFFPLNRSEMFWQGVI